MANTTREQVLVIGAGFGGLATALRIAVHGVRVTVIEARDAPGGKARQVPSDAGPIDAGPTVLTLRSEFDDLYALCGHRLEDHVTLIRQPILARHWWPDGTSLDLHSDPEASAEAIRVWGGARAAADFRAFHATTAQAYAAFGPSVTDAAHPRIARVGLAVLRNPALWPMIARTLARDLEARFAEPRLRQLFGRYATYVGGVPAASPAILGVIWQAESQGVWAVQGGIHGLAMAIADLARQMGVEFRYGQAVSRIVLDGRRIAGVDLADGTRVPGSKVVFNGDPAALGEGLLGSGLRAAVRRGATYPRSHSAHVWTFAAKATRPAFGPDLLHHNVFFGSDPVGEYAPLRGGKMQTDPTIYICAEDRAAGQVPTGPERFEIILNAPPVPAMGSADSEEYETCRNLTLSQLARFGISFDPLPVRPSLTTPQEFARLHPGSAGSIYGLSPHGPLASFRRPVAQTLIPGLYLTGGGVHPGPGVPMATRSGRHAAEAIMRDLALTSRSTRTAMRGGTSTGSATMGKGPFPSSDS
jgi:1-hydroxycarotenoid 3,4-desaturase